MEMPYKNRTAAMYNTTVPMISARVVFGLNVHWPVVGTLLASLATGAGGR